VAGRVARLVQGRWARRAALAAIGVAVPVAMFAAVRADAAISFSASASVAPQAQYLDDSAGTVFVFTVNNTGTTPIGAVEIAPPSADWTVVGCPAGPSPAWTRFVLSGSCRYRADVNTGDWLQGGQSATFHLRATTTPGTQDRIGTWPVTVSNTRNLLVPANTVGATADGSGALNTHVYSFQVLNVGVAAAVPTAGTACPPLAHKEPTASARNVVVCGRNRATTALTPAAAFSSLSGDWLASPGGFFSRSVAPSATSVVLANWASQITTVRGTGYSVTAAIGSTRIQLSPTKSFTGYEAKNRDPVATDDTATTDENSPVDVTVLTNDTDADGDSLSVASLDTTGTAGSVSTDGTKVTYDPNGQFASLGAGQSGTDTFTYTAGDGHGGTAIANVTVTVTGVDSTPTAPNTSASPLEDTQTPVTLNGSDPEGATVTFDIVTAPSHGNLDCSTGCSSTVNYTPTADYHGPDTFTYTASDGGLTSSAATASISVISVNDAPSFTKGADDTAVESTPRTVSGWATGMSGGPADESAQTLTFNVTPTDTTLFTVQPAIDPATGDLTYTPGANAGSTSVSVTLSDNGGTDHGGVDTSPAQTFTITVAPPNATPTADATSASGNEDGGAIAVTLTGHDADDNDLTFSVGTASNGSVGTSTSVDCSATNDCTATVAYTPNANYNGSDSFTYKANDGKVDSSPATVSVIVNPVNDAPSFTKGGDQTVDEDSGAQSVSGWATNVSAGPANESSQTPTFHTSTNNDALFSALPAIDPASGDLTYQIAPNANGVATVTVSLSDDGGTANGGSDTSPNQTLTITVNPVNDPPVANGDSGATTEDTFTNVSVLANDTDVDGDTLSINAIDTSGTVGTVTNNGDGTVKYNAAGHFDSLAQGQTATDTFTYTASDGHGGTNNATVTITITGVNDAPVGVADSLSGAQGNTQLAVSTTGSGPTVSASGNVLSNDTDVDSPSSAFTATVTSPTPNGARVTMNSDGTFLYVPPQGFTGNDTFTYTVHDNNSTNPKTGTGTVTVSVAGPLVWYVDNSQVSAGDGRSDAPFNSVAPLTTGGSADAKDGSGDVIFLYSGSGSYTGGLVLEASQQLLGQPQGLTVNSHALVPAGGTNPSIKNASGDAITLANGVDVERVDVAPGSSGAAVKGTSITTATIGANTAISGGTGGGVVLSGVPALRPVVAAAFTSVSAGTNISIGSTITSSSGNSVSVANRTGGTVTFTGSITDTGSGVSLSTNTGATLAFTGQLSLTTTTHFGFTAVSGGTVTATNANNAVTTTTGTAVDIASTTIGASGVVFKSVSANGAANGIVLNSTGSSGNLSVTGDGSTANSGGVIQNTTSHAISLTSTQTPTFAWLKIANPAHAGVKGTGVHGFSFTHGTVTTFGSAASNVKDAAFGFNDTSTPQNNLDGVVTIASNTISNGYGSGVDIDNYSGTISDANISSNTLTSSASQASSKGDAITMNLLGTASGVASLTKAEITSNAITNFPSGNGIVVQGGNTASSGAPAGSYGTPNATPGTGTNIIGISANTIVGDATNHMAAAGILASVEGKGSGNFSVTNNGTVATPVRNMLGQAIGVGVSGSATANFNVTGNVVAPDSAFGSTGIGVGTDVNIQADSSTLTTPTINAIVASNTVSQSDGYGIEVEQRDSNGTANVKVTNNTVSAPKTSVATSIEVMEGSTGSASYNPTLCSTISGNTAATAADDGAGDRAPGITLDKLPAGSNSPATYKFGITGLTPSPATAAQTQLYVASQNPASGIGTGFWGVGTVFAGSDGFTSCTLGF
jgi:hypothetical protein